MKLTPILDKQNVIGLQTLSYKRHQRYDPNRKVQQHTNGLYEDKDLALGRLKTKQLYSIGKDFSENIKACLIINMISFKPKLYPVPRETAGSMQISTSINGLT